MREEYDVVIVGEAVASCLTANPDFIGMLLMVEKETTDLRA
ncbi:MAG: hypothetical protein AB7E21_11405 [Pseudodonghicola sp.]